MKKLTAQQVIQMANLKDTCIYMQTDTGSVDTGKGWKETILELDPEEDSAFDPAGDGAHLVEVVQDQDGNWIEA